MRIFLLSLIIISLIAVPVLAETVISLELYPDRMDGIFDNRGLINGNEWFATTIEVEKNFGKFMLTTDIQTFFFGTTGFSYYPSSVKFTSSISYQVVDNLSISFSHFCHHYFHQFENNYSDQDTLTFEYSF